MKSWTEYFTATRNAFWVCENLAPETRFELATLRITAVFLPVPVPPAPVPSTCALAGSAAAPTHCDGPRHKTARRQYFADFLQQCGIAPSRLRPMPPQNAVRRHRKSAL